MDVRILKDKIQNDLDSYAVLNHYLQPYHTKGRLKSGQHISNPFLSQPQKTPSFNLYDKGNGNWRYKDFATGDDGDCFELVQQLFRCDFKEAVLKIATDFNLDVSEVAEPNFTIQLAKWDTSNLAFWQQYGISETTLERYQVVPVLHYKRPLKNGNELHVQSTATEPLFAYRIHTNCYKIYSPFAEKYRFSWLGQKPSNYVFGWKQLPDKGKIVFITGGEKDVLALAAHKQQAISLNSETAFPSDDLMKKLKERFENVVVLYDLDTTGLQHSKKITEHFEVQRMLLPNKLKEQGGKDIADFFRLGFALNDAGLKMEDYRKKSSTDQYLSQLLETQKALTKRKAETIAKTQPILTHYDNAIIFPRTINIIQGKAGVHKSRLAETFCSAFIKQPMHKNHLLGFKTNIMNRPTVCYVDTERNLTEQFPFALQQILQKAGYNKEETPYHFDYISLLEIPRKDRFAALNEYLSYVRGKFDGHLVIVLDVVTDCIKDFNRSEDSMQLIDLMNESINKFNVTFIGLIHENPGSTDKARGHLGTELMNKSSTVIQVGFEKGKNGQPTDLIALNFLKTRSTKRYDSIYLRYCNDAKGLVLADANDIAEVMQSRHLKAEIGEISAFLKEYLKVPTPNKVLVDILTDEFDCSSKIIRTRLKELCESKTILQNHLEQDCILTKTPQGKEIIYELQVQGGTVEPTVENQLSMVTE